MVDVHPIFPTAVVLECTNRKDVLILIEYRDDASFSELSRALRIATQAQITPNRNVDTSNSETGALRLLLLREERLNSDNLCWVLNVSTDESGLWKDVAARAETLDDLLSVPGLTLKEPSCVPNGVVEGRKCVSVAQLNPISVPTFNGCTTTYLNLRSWRISTRFHPRSVNADPLTRVSIAENIMVVMSGPFLAVMRLRLPLQHYCRNAMTILTTMNAIRTRTCLGRRETTFGTLHPEFGQSMSPHTCIYFHHHSRTSTVPALIVALWDEDM